MCSLSLGGVWYRCPNYDWMLPVFYLQQTVMCLLINHYPLQKNFLCSKLEATQIFKYKHNILKTLSQHDYLCNNNRLLQGLWSPQSWTVWGLLCQTWNSYCGTDLKSIQKAASYPHNYMSSMASCSSRHYMLQYQPVWPDVSTEASFSSLVYPLISWQ